MESKYININKPDPSHAPPKYWDYTLPTALLQVLIGSTALREQVKSRKSRATVDREDLEEEDDDTVLFDKSEMSHDLD